MQHRFKFSSEVDVVGDASPGTERRLLGAYDRYREASMSHNAAYMIDNTKAATEFQKFDNALDEINRIGDETGVRLRYK